MARAPPFLSAGIIHRKSGLRHFSRWRTVVWLCLRRALHTGVVHVVLALQQDLRDRHHSVAVLRHVVQDGGESLRGVEGGIVEQADGPALYPLRHPLGDFACRDVLPVQTVPAGKGFKSLGHKEFRDFALGF